MKSLIKSFFRSGEEPVGEGLNHVKHLNVGDMLELDNDYSLPDILRGRTFQVVQNSLYEYEDVDEREWVLKGDDNTTIFCTYENDDGDEEVAFGVKLTPEEVESIFNLEEFASIFDDEYSSRLLDITPIEKYTGWLGKQYDRSEFREPGCFHKTGKIEGQGEPFDYYSLSSACGGYDIGIEVWRGGETDVLIYIRKPIEIIKHYWGKQRA